MIDHAILFHTSGAVLMTYDDIPWSDAERDAVFHRFIEQVFVCQRANTDDRWRGAPPYVFAWKSIPAYEVFAVVVYQAVLNVPYIDALLESMAEVLNATYGSVLQGGLDAMLEHVPFTLPMSMLIAKCAKPAVALQDKQPKKKGKVPAPSPKPRIDYSVDRHPLERKKMQIDMDINAWTVDHAPQKTASSFWTGAASFWTSLTTRVLTAEALAPMALKMEAKLIDKNVAAEVASEIVRSVVAGATGKSVSSFGSVQALLTEQMSAMISGILTPPNALQLLPAIDTVTATRKPYSIVFCGVNGVGKSTTLAKVAAYLLQQKKKVALAACDTFRSGAIEQLKIHATTLEVPLYTRGYEKEPAAVAAAAVKEASENGIDVLLIDTAGRMQDNTLLMAALVALLNRCHPDAVLFVGEALVGNEAVDQLRKFMRAIEEGTGGRHGIDGIVLSKFDTIDDKVGAALSMARITGKPVVFVGVGQNYVDLKRLQVDAVVEALLS